MSWYDHPLVGRQASRSLAGLTYLGVVMAIVSANWMLSRTHTGDARLWLALPLDILGWLATVSVGSTVLVALGLAWWNGGVGLATGIAITPALFGTLIREQATVHPDLVLAMCAGMAAAWIASYRTYRTDHTKPGLDISVGVAVATSLYAMTVLRTAARRAGSHAEATLVVASLLFLLGMAVPGWWLVSRIAWQD